MTQQRQLIVLAALLVLAIGQSFNLWPIVDPASLATKLNVSQTCITALNTTVACDPTTFRMAGQVDMFLWDGDNITTLCTASCIDSTTNWISGVYDACDPTDTIYIDTKLVPIDTVAIRYTDGLGLACLTDDQLNITYYDSLYDDDDDVDTTRNTTTALNPTLTTTSLDDVPTETVNDTIPDTNVTYEYNYNQPNYCFNESQLWTGVDIPDCDLDPDDPLCDDPSDGMRIANYYNDTLLCSPCFLSVFWWRINSPFLPDTNHSDYLIEQFQDIQDVCNVTMFDSLIRQSPPGYAVSTPPSYSLPGQNTSSTLCTGQTLSDSSASCNTLSQQYGVTTGDLQAATGNADCTFSSPICVPYNCTLSVISSNTSCDAFAASLSTSTVNVTHDLFLSWNPNIQGLCDALTEGQYVCTGPPGGSYLLPAPITNNTNTSGQQRGRQGSGSNPNGPLGAEGPTTNSTAQAPTQPGINPNCTLFAYATTNDTCYQFSQDFSITLTQLTEWNPILGYPDGSNCTTQFWAGYDYCVQVPGSGGTTTAPSSNPTSSSSPTSSLPYPTQSGITPSCNQYAEAVSGDYCYQFAQDNNITTAELYAWNPILGPNGANCSTEFLAGYDYCVGISSSGSVMMSSTSTTPTTSALPTQSGIALNCDKLVEAESGNYCYEFAQDNNITTAELYEWNTILGPNGVNCSTEFQAGYGYCVAVS